MAKSSLKLLCNFSNHNTRPGDLSPEWLHLSSFPERTSLKGHRVASSFPRAVFVLIFSFLLVSVPRTQNTRCTFGFPSSTQIDAFPFLSLSSEVTASSSPPFSFLSAGGPSPFVHQLQPLLLILSPFFQFPSCYHPVLSISLLLLLIFSCIFLKKT